MLTTTAMCTRIRVADGKNTTTAVGTAYRTPDRHSRSTPNSRRASGVISAPLPPLGAREAGAAALAALIVVREAVGTLEAVVVGTVGISVVSVVAEAVGGGWLWRIWRWVSRRVSAVGALRSVEWRGPSDKWRE